MKITFEDRSYLEILKSTNPGKLLIVVAATSFEDSNNFIVNSVEITEKDLIKLIKSVDTIKNI